jgi:hypothetical protein
VEDCASGRQFGNLHGRPPLSRPELPCPPVPWRPPPERPGPRPEDAP